MLAAVLSVIIIAAIAAGLAAMLVAADRFVSNYGECEITINDDRKLTVDGGASLLESLTQNQIFIPSACGGRGTCAYCKVRVLDGGGPVVPTEEPYLDAAERERGVRLSCQLKVKQPLRIEIPAELLSIQAYRCACTRIRELTHDIREFRFTLQSPESVDYTPGQYVQLQSQEYDGGEEVYRAYSIASDPAQKGIIDLVIRLVPGGICTTWCFERLHEGDEVTINGPYGEFRLTDNDATLIFIAGGSGMAPIKCFLQHMLNTGDQREATFFFGANEVRELFFLEEMAAFEEILPRFRFIPVVARPEEGAAWDGETGFVTDAVDRHVGDGAECEAYLCGSPAMIDATVEVLSRKGVSEERIFYDKFS